VTKAEIYQRLADGGASDAAADGGVEAGPDAGTSYSSYPCPTSQQVSDYFAETQGHTLDPSELGTPTDEGDSCVYPVDQSLCD
jgi:hypothetical protein